jgi:MFS family permease
VGYFTLSFVGSSLLGPLVGGFIIDRFSWEWIFYFNIPFILLVIAVCHNALRLPFKRKDARIDFVGAALLSATIACLMIGLEFGRKGWTQQNVLLLFAAACAGLVAFIYVEQRVAEPMIPLRLFSNPIVRGSALLGFCASVSTYGAGTFLSLYFQDSLFVSPTESGLRSAPQMLGVTAATFGIGRLIAKSGKYKRFPMIGAVLSCIGLLSVAQIDGSTKYIVLVVPMIIMGFGTASIFTTTSIASQNAVDFHDLGVTTATVMFFRSLGGSISLAIFGTILNSTIRREIPKRTGILADKAASIIRSPEEIQKLPPIQKQAVVDSIAMGVSTIYYLCAAVAVVAFIFAVLLPEKELRGRAGLSDAMEGGH